PRAAHDLRDRRRQIMHLVGVGAAMIGRRAVLGGAAVAIAAPALGQGYPNKPIKMVVPYPPGGGTDGPLVLLANNNVPGTDYASVMAAIAKEPKKYFSALSSGGSAGHIATLAFLKRTGLPLDTILYKGTAPANADLLSGNVQLFMDPWTALLPLATSGRAKGLFVTSKERAQLAPSIPTSAEGGLKDFNISWGYGVWAPKDLPDALVDKLAMAMAEVSKDPAFIAKTTSLGIVPTARGPKEFAAFIKSEVETNPALLNDAGYKPE